MHIFLVLDTVFDKCSKFLVFLILWPVLLALIATLTLLFAYHCAADLFDVWVLLHWLLLRHCQRLLVRLIGFRGRGGLLSIYQLGSIGIFLDECFLFLVPGLPVGVGLVLSRSIEILHIPDSVAHFFGHSHKMLLPALRSRFRSGF
jgi:hypothetical protein